MARIRTVKPEFWTDERVGECSPTARLLFVATWNFADDEGGLERSAKQLKAQAFPYDDIDCEPLVQELLKVGLLIEYEAGGKKYLHIKGFSSHQKIEKKAKPRFPVYEPSPTPPRLLPDSSVSSAVSSLEGKGREGKSACAPVVALIPDPPEEPPPQGLNPDAWRRWLEYRVKIRKPLKQASIPAAQRALAAFGSDHAAVVEQSIAQGWTGLFELKASIAKPKEDGRVGLPTLRV